MSHANFYLEPAEPLRSALNALKTTTGLSASLLANDVAEHGSRLAIKAPHGQEVELTVEVKATVDRRDQLSTFKYRHGGAVLVTCSLSNAMAEQCRALNIQFLDTAGNCFLNQTGMFVFVSGRKETTLAQAATTRGLTPAVLRVVFAVLTDPLILESNVRHIADTAAISHGAAANALLMLQETGLIGKAASGRRILLLPERWLSAWTEGYLGRLRPKLETYRMSSSFPLASLIEQVSPALREVVLGGEAAAAYFQPGLKPGALTLYVDLKNPRVMRDLVPSLKLRRDPNGNVELVEMFWNTQELPSFPTVPDALIYADLIGTADERSIDTAATVKKRILNHVAGKSSPATQPAIAGTDPHTR